MSDVFRFVSVRPVQRADETAEGLLIRAYGGTGQESPLHIGLRTSRAAGDRAGMLERAATFVASSEFVPTLSVLTTALAPIDRWLLSQRDRPNPGLLIAELAKNKIKPAQTVETQAYKTDRRRTADSLLALTILATERDRHHGKLLRGMHLFGLIERLAVNPDPIKTADDVYQVLAINRVVLPADVFPLPPESAPEPLQSELARSISGTAAGELNGESEVSTVLTAINELRSLLSERVGARAVATEHATEPAKPKKRSAARDRAGSGGDEPNGAALLATATVPTKLWELPAEEVAGLSPATRAALADAAGATPPVLDVPDAIARLEARAATLGATLPNGGNGSTVTRLGTGYVDLRPFASAHNGRHRAAEQLATIPMPTVRPPVIADLMVVRQVLQRYEMGEVAHIENVLKGEFKERVHRRAMTREETVLVEVEREEAAERDVQSTERFELERETTTTVHQDSQLEAGVTITASYGPTVSVTGNLGYASNHSKDEAARVASSYARDVTERSVSTIRERTFEQRVTRTLTEIEETNKHGVDNAAGTDHVVGIYRWVDKVYEAQVYNYGLRLLLEFSVPEPAAFFLHSFAEQTPEGLTLSKPEPPMVPLEPPSPDPSKPRERPLSPADITVSSYLYWVAKYRVAGVTSPPKPFETLGLAWEEPYTEGPTPDPSTPAKLLYKARKELKVPDGYKATAVSGAVYASAWTKDTYLAIGKKTLRGPVEGPGQPAMGSMPFSFDAPLVNVMGEIPVALVIENAWGYSIALEVLCERTDETLAKWQLATFEAIMRAYLELKAQYDEQIASAGSGRGIGVAGRNPEENRSIERSELKKSAIAIMTGQRFEEFDAMSRPPSPGYPEIDFEEARSEGKVIQFFEQAFEWPQMTYVYYPYFWGRKANWKTTSQLDDPDPIFAEFLRAGAARVMVPARPGFEDAVLHYLATHEIWNGDEVPQVDDPLYVSILQELRDRQIASASGVPIGEPWEVRLPTSLAVLQNDSTLPSFP